MILLHIFTSSSERDGQSYRHHTASGTDAEDADSVAYVNASCGHCLPPRIVDVDHQQALPYSGRHSGDTAVLLVVSSGDWSVLTFNIIMSVWSVWVPRAHYL